MCYDAVGVVLGCSVACIKMNTLASDPVEWYGVRVSIYNPYK